MKIAVNLEIKGLDGEPMQFVENEGKATEKKVTLTFKKVSTDSLMAMFQDEKDLTGEDKIKRAMLAQKIYSATDIVELSLDEAQQVKKVVNKLYGTMPYFRVHEILESAGSVKVE